jgi:outer membrane protein OmpA-like peptidoglycan-associated protein
VQYTNDYAEQYYRLLKTNHSGLSKVPQLAGLLDRPDILTVLILGYTDGDGLPEDNRCISQQWADAVKSALEKKNARGTFKALGMGADPLGDQRLQQIVSAPTELSFRL